MKLPALNEDQNDTAFKDEIRRALAEVHDHILRSSKTLRKESHWCRDYTLHAAMHRLP